MKADLRHNLLFVAGGPTGQAYVYDLKSGATVASFQLGTAPSTFVNDVVVTGGFAYFTDSVQPHLYRIPIHRNGTVGTASQLALTGPAANITGAFNVNGIAAAPGGKYLILSHSTDGTLYRVNRKTGASVAIAGATLPNVDGILLDGHRIWAVQNTNNQITELRLSRWFTKATVRKVITDSAFETPTAVAKFGHRLAVVNAKFDTGFPPTATSFEVVVVKREPRLPVAFQAVVPPTTVIQIGSSRIASGAAANRSPSITVRSASLPGSIEPRRSSRWSARAASIV
jgi:hypothetical protein